MYTRILFLSVFILFACNFQDKQNTSDNQGNIPTSIIKNPASLKEKNSSEDQLPMISFNKETYDFGKITEGEKIEYSFKFTNMGKGDLVIVSATATCGCTVPSYPKQPIKPGDKGFIQVIFDSKGKTGKQQKAVTIIANTIPKTKQLYIVGEVLPAKDI